MATEFEKGVDKISQEVSKAAENVKETASDFGGWWKRSSLEEKIGTFVGIFLLVCGIRGLSNLVIPAIILTLGILCVTGYFEKPIKSIINWFKSTCKSKKSDSKKENKEEKLEKVDIEEDEKNSK